MPVCEFEQRPDIKWRRQYAKGEDWSRKQEAARLFLAWCPGERLPKRKSTFVHSFIQRPRKTYTGFVQRSFLRLAAVAAVKESTWFWPPVPVTGMTTYPSEPALPLDRLTRKTAVQSETLEQRFYKQADKWQRETGHLSSPTQKMLHPSYQAILGMALEHKEELIPLLIRDLKENRRMWFWALSYLTQDNPIRPEDAGKIDRMINAWVSWGETKGLL